MKYARTFGQDIMKGEWGGAVTQNNLTWVKGSREKLDETSRKNLAAGPKAIGTQPRVASKIAAGDIAGGMASEQSGTSIFDPVLCELVYTWFTPVGAKILDPFAGGSVRGIVANYLGRHYTGVDLRAEQIAANEAQAVLITPANKPRWICGNSLDSIPNEQFDCVFSCPPYYDLEVYSDQEGDLSACGTYAEFLQAYRAIIRTAIDRLNQDRFACFCVGDIRDKKGIYRNFVSDTISAFQDAGAKLYNEAILITAVGSLPIRVGRQFDTGRKLGKTHQNVLFFIKGDPKKATEYCGKVEIGELVDG